MGRKAIMKVYKVKEEEGGGVKRGGENEEKREKWRRGLRCITFCAYWAVMY